MPDQPSSPDASLAPIRRAGPAEVPALYALADACRADMLGRGIGQWVAGYPTLEHVREAAERGATWVIAPQGPAIASPIASVVLDGRHPPQYEAVQWGRPLDATALYVHRLCVDPRHRRQGLARRLMAFAEEQARAAGCLAIRLDTHADNLPAQRLYADLGYMKTGTVEFPLRQKHFICMEKLLT